VEANSSQVVKRKSTAKSAACYNQTTDTLLILQLLQQSIKLLFYCEKFLTPAIHISMTFHDLDLIPGLSSPAKCDF